MSSIPLALPKSILPSPDGATSAGISSQWVRVQPNNISQVVSNVTTILAPGAIPTQITLGAQQLNFDLPTGGGANVYADTSKSTISFRVKYSLTTVASTTYSGTTAFLQSSAHSYFNRMTTFVAGNQVDDVTGLDVAMDEQNGWQYDVTQRDVLFNQGFRGEQATVPTGEVANFNYTQGHSIPPFTGTGLSALTSNYFSYEIPFVNSLFGIGNKSMCPIGKLAKSSISLYTPQIAPIVLLNAAGGAGAGAQVQITIDQIAINMFTISLDEASMKLLSPMKDPHYMAGLTYRVGSGAINQNSTGSVAVQVPVRVKSARSLCTRFSESNLNVAGSVNGIFDAKMPLVNSLNYFIASSKRVPSNPHNALVSPSTIYSRAIMANYDSTYDSWKQKSSNTSSSFYKFIATTIPPTVLECDKLTYDAGSATIAGSLSSFSFCEDLRCASSANFLSGADLTVSNSFLEANFAFAPSSNLFVTFIAKADIIFIVMPDGSVESRV